jgi:hypothetical protein
MAETESQAWFNFRTNQHMGTARGREGIYKLEAAALAGMNEPELALWLYGEACQPMACVQGVHPLHPSLASHVSATFPPRTLLPSDEWQSEPWNGDFARSYSNAIPPALITGLAHGLAQGTTFWKFQEKAHSDDGQFVSYWHNFANEPTSLMDQAARLLLPLLPSYVSKNAVGAEYWGYNQDLAKGCHAFHFDMDSPRRAQTGEWRFPIATCIVFLSDAVGGPTLILDQSREPGSPLAERGWLVRPDQPGTVYCFDSTLLHGVMPAFSEEQKTTKSGTTVRTSINIVYWADECTHSNKFPMTCFERSLPIHRESTPVLPNHSRHRRWCFSSFVIRIYSPGCYMHQYPMVAESTCVSQVGNTRTDCLGRLICPLTRRLHRCTANCTEFTADFCSVCTG